MEKRIIEINGIKMEVDLREAAKIESYKIGDQIKVLKKEYGDQYKSFYGVVVGFDDFKQLPTILIAYVDAGYGEAAIKMVYLNNKSEDVEICPAENGDIFIDRNDVLDKLDREVDKKEMEIVDLKQKRKYFLERFGKYFDEKK